MSRTNGSSSDADVLIGDEDEYVDKKLKERLVETRKEVAESKTELFTAAKMGDIDTETAISVWGDRVRKFLLVLEPIITQNEMELPDAEKIYKSKRIGVVRVDPPQKYQQNPRQQLRSGVGTVVENGPLRPKQLPIYGLVDVIENERVTAQWDVKLRELNDNSRSERYSETVVEAAPIGREVLRDAVRYADLWLQSAGVGIEISASDYYGGEEPGI